MTSPGPFLRALATIALATAVPASAREVTQLVPTGDGIETIEAAVAGHRGTFLFDSGIGVSAITPAVAAAIGCTPWAKVTGFRATGERVDLPRCNAARVTIGTTSTALSQLTVIDLSRFMGTQAEGLAGVIGLDALAGHVVTLDVAHHRLVVEDDASLANVRANATEVPVRFVRDAEGAALTVDVGVPTPSGMAWMELDTGNYGPSMVDRSVAAAFDLDPASTAAQRWRPVVAGHVAITGPVVVKDLVLDGNLGRAVLGRWLVTLDLAHGRGWLRTIIAER